MRVLIVARQPLVRTGLRAVLEREPDIEVAATFSSEAELRASPASSAANLVLLTLDASAEGSGAGVDFGEENTGAGVLLLGPPAAPRQIAAALQAGARGYLALDRDDAEIVAAVRAAAAGLTVLESEVALALATSTPAGTATPVQAVDDTLTPRELQVLQLVAHGLANKTIAQRLKISEHTVKFHVGAILTKLDAASRTEAVSVAARRGLLML